MLRGVSFEVPPRSLVALAGRSDVGKSTVLALWRSPPDRTHPRSPTSVSSSAGRRSRTAECALLVIAHRPSTLRNADRVVLPDGGRVVARGTPAQLLCDSELYRRLAT